MRPLARSSAMAIILLATGALLSVVSPSTQLLITGLVGVMAVAAGALLLRQGRREVGAAPSRHISLQTLALTSVYCKLASTLVFRIRTTADLQSQPIDAAGALRLGLGAAAVTLALGVIAAHRRTGEGERPSVPRTAAWYACYTLVVGAGVVTAVGPGFVLFRFWELFGYVVVWYALYLVFAGRMEEPIRHVYRFLWVLVATLALPLLVAPSTVLRPSRGGILPFRLVGAFPTLSADTVGTIGVLLVLRGLGSRTPRRMHTFVGIALIALAQYRTGYIALIAIVAVWMFLNEKPGAKVALAASVIVGALLLNAGLFTDAWTRGDSSQTLSTLNSRAVYWREAVNVAERSPLIGTGLSSGTRFEVFSGQLGLHRVSTVHSTWIEAYVGTGLLGLTALVLVFASGFAAATRIRRTTGNVFPLLLFVVLAVRSLTGTTIELPGSSVLLMLCAVSLGPVAATSSSWVARRAVTASRTG